MKICPSCNAKNLNTAQTCDNCGASLKDLPDKVNPSFNHASERSAEVLEAIFEKLCEIEQNTKRNNEIVVSDINMNFRSMVNFMVKWVIASIPAAIVLFFLATVLTTIFGGLFAALMR